MNELLDALGKQLKRELRAKKQPAWTKPMLATLTKDYFSDPQWIFERKLDGERALAFINASDTRLMSRNKKRLNSTYPELIDELRRQTPAMVVDGKIVAFSASRTSFSRLQGRMKIGSASKALKSRIKVYYYVFDILFLDGYDLTGLPLRVRKGLLREAMNFQGALRYTAHRNEKGEAYHREACKKGWEGIIAKDAQSIYSHSRSKKWLKLKCVNQQELVIGGYTEPQGSRHDFGALLVGYYRGKTLHYAGKVGTGFDDETLTELGHKLRDQEMDECPFEETNQARQKGAHWVRPTLVAEVGFTEWTGQGRLRHPRYIGLRHDKKAKKVVREKPQSA